MFGELAGVRVRHQQLCLLVGSTHLKNICQNGSFPQLGVKRTTISSNHQDDFTCHQSHFVLGHSNAAELLDKPRHSNDKQTNDS